MFKWLSKKNTESATDLKEIIVPCACDNGNEHCDLVLQLRKCQDLKKMISQEIETLNKSGHELIKHFINFLYEFEKRGLQIGSFNARSTSERNIGIIEWTLQELSSTDIFRITEELKTYKNKNDIICEKRRTLKAVEDDIKNIKAKLGIE